MRRSFTRCGSSRFTATTGRTARPRRCGARRTPRPCRPSRCARSGGSGRTIRRSAKAPRCAVYGVRLPPPNRQRGAGRIPGGHAAPSLHAWPPADSSIDGPPGLGAGRAPCGVRTLGVEAPPDREVARAGRGSANLRPPVACKRRYSADPCARAAVGGMLGTVLKGGIVVELEPALVSGWTCASRVSASSPGARTCTPAPGRRGDRPLRQARLPGAGERAPPAAHGARPRHAPAEAARATRTLLEQVRWRYEDALDLDAVQVAATRRGPGGAPVRHHHRVRLALLAQGGGGLAAAPGARAPRGGRARRALLRGDGPQGRGGPRGGPGGDGRLREEGAGPLPRAGGRGAAASRWATTR